MKRKSGFTIGELCRSLDISRSAILNYERLGLLKPAKRSESGYRYYSQDDWQRLEKILLLRGGGLSLNAIQSILAKNQEHSFEILEKRLDEISSEICQLRQQQMVIFQLMDEIRKKPKKRKMTKELWSKMLEAAGLDERGMQQWHAVFEAEAPSEHQSFLVSLGITDDEVKSIRHRSKTIWSSLK